MSCSIFLRASLLVMAAPFIALTVALVPRVTAVSSYPANDHQTAADDTTPAHAAVIDELWLETDEEKLEEVKALLTSISTGREALQILEMYQVQVEFRPGQGTYYYWPTNKVVIESKKDALGTVFSLVHEMTHVYYHRQGMWASLSPVSRQEFIEQLVAEEAEADTRAIEAKLELEAIGVPVRIMAASREEAYLEAYQDAVAVARAEVYGITEAELKALGRRSGKEALFQEYMNGRAVSSHNLETYPAVFGRAWDKANKSAETANVTVQIGLNDE